MKVKSARKISYRTISMPETLYHALEQKIEKTGFANVSQFVAFVMRTLLSDSSESDAEKKVKVRLKSLGYLAG